MIGGSVFWMKEREVKTEGTYIGNTVLLIPFLYERGGGNQNES